MHVSKRHRMLFTAEKITPILTKRDWRFTTMTPLGMLRDVTCHILWRHNCFSNSIQFELIYFISIWTSPSLLKISKFLCIRKRNELFDHPSYLMFSTFSRSVPSKVYEAWIFLVRFLVSCIILHLTGWNLIPHFPAEQPIRSVSLWSFIVPSSSLISR